MEQMVDHGPLTGLMGNMETACLPEFLQFHLSSIHCSISTSTRWPLIYSIHSTRTLRRPRHHYLPLLLCMLHV